jgi:Coenzyme PQQ synthesis protein D (PqqD)
MPTLDSRVLVSNDVLFQELQGEAVLLNLKSGVYFGLDSVGTRIWELLADQDRLSDVARSIVTEFDVTEDRCAADLMALVSDLERHGLVTVS